MTSQRRAKFQVTRSTVKYFFSPPANSTGYECPGHRDAEDFSCFCCGSTGVNRGLKKILFFLSPLGSTFFWPGMILLGTIFRTFVPIIGIHQTFSGTDLSTTFTILFNFCKIKQCNLNVGGHPASRIIHG